MYIRVIFLDEGWNDMKINAVNASTMFGIGIILSLAIIQVSYAQSGNSTNSAIKTFHNDTDVSPIEAVIMINEHDNKSAFFQPHTVTVRVGGEILIANNASSSSQSVTSGSGPDDPMAGKTFDTDKIKRGEFVEYVPENLKPGNYSFYSSADPQAKGLMIVVP
jgi:plastocyanin